MKSCPACTFLNPPSYLSCGVCQTLLVQGNWTQSPGDESSNPSPSTLALQKIRDSAMKSPSVEQTIPNNSPIARSSSFPSHRYAPPSVPSTSTKGWCPNCNKEVSVADYPQCPVCNIAITSSSLPSYSSSSSSSIKKRGGRQHQSDSLQHIGTSKASIRSCPRCTLVNVDGKDVCEVCSYVFPVSSSSGTSQVAARDGIEDAVGFVNSKRKYIQSKLTIIIFEMYHSLPNSLFKLAKE